jgi:hypothetical protein
MTETKMYHDVNLTKVRMNSRAPELTSGFWAFDKAAVADGAIAVKYKELIAAANPAWPRGLRSMRPVGRVAEL